MSYNTGDWIWTKQAVVTDNSDTRCTSIGKFPDDNYIIVGYFTNSVTFDNITLTTNGSYDMFVIKINSSGKCIWVKQVGNIEYDTGIGLSVKDNYAIITGQASGTLYFDNIILNCNSTGDTYIAKIDNSGNWIWATSVETDSYNVGYIVEICFDESIIVSGIFNDYVTFGDINLTCSTTINTFIAKLNNTGTEWLWAKSIPGQEVYSRHISLLSDNSIVLGGVFYNNAYFDDITLNGWYYNMFISKMDQSGNWIWVKSFNNNSSTNDIGEITILEDDSMLITGNFNDTITLDNITLSSDNTTIYVIKLDSSGNWIWGQQTNSIDGETYGFGIKCLPDGSAIVSGTYNNSLIIGDTTLTTIDDNICILKIDSSGNWVWAYSPTVNNTTFYYFLNNIRRFIIDNNIIIGVGSIHSNMTFGNTILTTNGTAPLYTKMAIDDISNISNILASSSITTQNNIIKNKNAIIKDLYDIHNLKKHKLNYMLKNIINKTENNNIDPINNLINLYY